MHEHRQAFLALERLTLHNQIKSSYESGSKHATQVLLLVAALNSDVHIHLAADTACVGGGHPSQHMLVNSHCH